MQDVSSNFVFPLATVGHFLNCKDMLTLISGLYLTFNGKPQLGPMWMK